MSNYPKKNKGRYNRNKGGRGHHGQKPRSPRDFFSPLYNKLLLIERGAGTDLSNSELVEIMKKVKAFTVDKKNEISTAQLRKIYTLVKKIKESDIDKLILLQPKLAYLAARQAKKNAAHTAELINGLVEEVGEEPNPDIQKRKLKSLKTLIEAMVAYHKFVSNN